MARPYRQQLDELDVFRALAHPVRRKILALLRRRPMTAGELAALAPGDERKVAQ